MKTSNTNIFRRNNLRKLQMSTDLEGIIHKTSNIDRF